MELVAIELVLPDGSVVKANRDTRWRLPESAWLLTHENGRQEIVLQADMPMEWQENISLWNRFARRHLLKECA